MGIPVRNVYAIMPGILSLFLLGMKAYFNPQSRARRSDLDREWSKLVRRNLVMGSPATLRLENLFYKPSMAVMVT